MRSSQVTPFNGHDTIIYFDPNDGKIKRNDDRGMIKPSDLLDLMGNFTVITAMAVDAGGAICWLDNGRVWKLPANIANPTFAAATEIINSGSVTDLAVDAFGNVIYAVGFTALHEATLGTANGTDYTATRQIVTGTALTNGSLSVDAVGNIYFQTTFAGPNQLKTVARGNGSTVHDVAGTVEVTVRYPSVGADGTLYYIDNSGGMLTNHTMRL